MSMKIVLPLAFMITIMSCGSSDNDAGAVRKNPGESPALRGITDSINRFPDNADLRIRRALMLSQMNLHERATQDYRKAWEITGDQHVLLEYASNLLLAQQLPEAVTALEEGRRKFPKNSEFSRRLAEINIQKGNVDDALAQFDNMIVADSTNFEAWYGKGLLLARMKDTARAIDALEKSFSLVPINYTGMALANIYVAQKNPRAIDICNTILSYDSANVQTDPVFMKGVYYADTRQHDSAIKQFDECIRRDWKMTDAYIEKGIILYERKQFNEAIKLFSMTTTVSNTDADGYYWLGRCYETTGKIQDAIENYERAVALDNTFTEARAALRRLGG
jgi:tetratricopeptide (TPR) repeat protein